MIKCLALTICLFLAACGGTQIVAQPTVMQDAPVTIPSIDPIKTSPVQWQVLKSSDMLKLAKTKPNTVIYGLDQSNFQNLNVDLSEATRYMKQEKAIDNMLSAIIISRQNSATPPAKK